MSKQSNVSFEILHLILVFYLRFSDVFIKCDLDIEQMYTLVYISANGEFYSRNGKKETKIIQREKIGRVLQSLFDCDKNKLTKLLNNLHFRGYVDEFPIPESAKKNIFKNGRNKVLSVEEEGGKKIDEFTDELKLLFNEIINPDHHLLNLPNTSNKGEVAESLVNFLQVFSASSNRRLF